MAGACQRDARRPVGGLRRRRDLDLALTNNNPNGAHALYRNLLPPDRAKRSVEVMLLDARGRATRAGSEVRVTGRGRERFSAPRSSTPAAGTVRRT